MGAGIGSGPCSETLAALLQLPSQFSPVEIDTLLDGLG